MSSETQARLFGVQLIRQDRTGKRTATGKNVRLFVFEKTRVVSVGQWTPKLTLKVEWHTRAGAWQAALRWAKKLSRGELQ